VAIQIKDLDAVHNTYTLIAKWTKGQNTLAMTGLAAAFAFVVDIKAPAAGFWLQPRAPHSWVGDQTRLRLMR